MCQSVSFSCIWHGTMELHMVLQSTVSEESFCNCHLVFLHPLFIWLFTPRSGSLCALLLSCVLMFFSNMYESLWIQSWLSSLLLAPHSWWLSVNLIRTISLQSSRSFNENLESYQAWFNTSVPSDCEQLMNFLSVWFSNQFCIHFIIICILLPKHTYKNSMWNSVRGISRIEI